MSVVTFTSRQFNQSASEAKKASLDGPVFITDRGQPSHVLLSIEEYRKLADQEATLIDLLAMPEAKNVDFDPPLLKTELHRPADFS